MKRKKTDNPEAEMEWFDPRNTERFALLGAAVALYPMFRGTTDPSSAAAAAAAAAVQVLEAVDSAAADAALLADEQNPE